MTTPDNPRSPVCSNWLDSTENSELTFGYMRKQADPCGANEHSGVAPAQPRLRFRPQGQYHHKVQSLSNHLIQTTPKLRSMPDNYLTSQPPCFHPTETRPINILSASQPST